MERRRRKRRESITRTFPRESNRLEASDTSKNSKEWECTRGVLASFFDNPARETASEASFGRRSFFSPRREEKRDRGTLYGVTMLVVRKIPLACGRVRGWKSLKESSCR